MMTRTVTKFKKKGETMDRNLHSYWFKANQRDHDDIADAIEKRFKKSLPIWEYGLKLRRGRDP